MCARQVLAGCAVLSLQDCCVFYPCCPACLSRLAAERRDDSRFDSQSRVPAARYRCSRCGFRCWKDQVDYRYRLSLRVVREASTFGVTVFGNSLNPFFGVPAGGLQRLVENSEELVGPAARSPLLVKAVQDCFLGRHFVFAIKVKGTEREPWLEDPDGNEPCRRERAQFVSTQMFPPTAPDLTVCTVLSCYQRRLQKAAAESAHPSKNSGAFASPLRTIGPMNSDFNETFLFPEILSQPLLGSRHDDHALAPTPPWQQSLGLVTSSAEQEERPSQDSRLMETNATWHPETHPGAEDSALKLQSGFQSSSSSRCSTPLIEGLTNSINVKSCFSSSQLRLKSFSRSPEQLPTPQQSKRFSSSSSSWEDLPISESLAEFWCDRNEDLKALGEPTNWHFERHRQTTRSFDEIANLSTEAAPACQGAAEITCTDEPEDVTNTPAPGGDGGNGLSDHGQRKGAERATASDDGEVQQDDDEEQEDYNCSADLFTDSLVHTETVRYPPDAGFHVAEMVDQHLKNETHGASQSKPPNKHKLKTSLFTKRDSIGLQDSDFVPPSQSTPIRKVSAITKPGVHSWRRLTDESKENRMQRMRSRNNKEEGSRFRRPEGITHRHPVGQPLKGTFNFESPRFRGQKRDSKNSREAVGDYEDGEGMVAPTPADGMRRRVSFRIRRRMQRSRRKGSLGEGGRALWDKTRTWSDGNESVGERRQNGSTVHLTNDEISTCDLSQDLFSDSV